MPMGYNIIIHLIDDAELSLGLSSLNYVQITPIAIILEDSTCKLPDVILQQGFLDCQT